MKKSILLLAIFATVAGNVFATTRTVSNHPNGGAQFATLDAAYNASANGDTLLLEGTDLPYEYGNGTNQWAKQLVVIGIGFNPAKSLPKKSKIQGIGATNFPLGFGGNGSNFFGIEFSTEVIGNSSLSNYWFFDCAFNNRVHFIGITYETITSFSFINCVFRANGSGYNVSSSNGFSYAQVSNFTFTSCIFTMNIYLFGSSNNLVDHCLFHTTSAVELNSGINTQNSIFANTASINVTSGTFNNNLCILNVPLPSGNGNLTNTNPNFVNVPLYAPYNESHDYHLQAGSPAIGAATDGSDIGPHGSGTNFSESGEVLIAPIVRSLSTSVGAGGTLNINVNATVPNSN